MPSKHEEVEETVAQLRRDIRRLAKERGHFILRLHVDGAERTPPSSLFLLEAPLSPECHAELMALVNRWLDEGKV